MATTQTPDPNTLRYPAEVFWSDEDEGYIALAPDLPGCSAFGKDEGTALVELRIAISAWIDAAKAAGNPIPSPSRPADPEQPSGKFLSRVPRTLHSQLIRGAKLENISLNAYVIHLLSGAVAVRSVEEQSRLLGRTMWATGLSSYGGGIVGIAPQGAVVGSGGFWSLHPGQMVFSSENELDDQHDLVASEIRKHTLFQLKAKHG